MWLLILYMLYADPKTCLFCPILEKTGRLVCFRLEVFRDIFEYPDKDNKSSIMSVFN